MKSLKFIYLTILFFTLYANASIPANAQTRPTFDSAIRDIRNNGVPDASYKFDDYLQYSPAVLTLGLKAFGYESRSSWGRMLASDAFSAAIMVGVVNGVKYSVRRMRPDNTSRNSFPSGHTATAFMMATMLHKEYGWRSPWFSFGGYAVAAVTGVSRIINDRHWATDVAAGALVGVGAVNLGYFISDKIFKDRHLSPNYEFPKIAFADSVRYYNIGLYFGHRFFLNRTAMQIGDICPAGGGGSSGVEADIPVVPKSGITVRASANSMTFNDSATSFNSYNFLAGGYWRHSFARVLEVSTKISAGYVIHQKRLAGLINGLDVNLGAGLAVMTGDNFKIKAFAEYETFRYTRQTPFVQSIIVGGGAYFLW